MTDCLGVAGTCRNCGNPVLEYLCNQPLLESECVGGEESANWDYWLSCSNALCENHKGSGWLQNSLDWVSKND